MVWIGFLSAFVLVGLVCYIICCDDGLLLHLGVWVSGVVVWRDWVWLVWLGFPVSWLADCGFCAWGVLAGFRFRWFRVVVWFWVLYVWG